VRVETIAVVGAGLMGRGIAYAAVAGGYRTVLQDVSPEALDRARQQVRADLDEGRARGRGRGIRDRGGARADRVGVITSRINAMIGELVDLVGLDTRLSVLEFRHRALGEKYHPAPLLVQHVKAGRLGKKAGRGVYDYARED